MGWVVKVDEKGRIVIPREVREILGFEKDTHLTLRVEKSSLVLEILGKGEDEETDRRSLSKFLG